MQKVMKSGIFLRIGILKCGIQLAHQLTCDRAGALPGRQKRDAIPHLRVNPFICNELILDKRSGEWIFSLNTHGMPPLAILTALQS